MPVLVCVLLFIAVHCYTVAELENISCPPELNARGYLCSQCFEDNGLPVYSYTQGCVRCENYKYNWLKYLAAAYLPLTLFYVLVTLFSINFTSPLLSGVVTMFQIVANPFMLKTYPLNGQYYLAFSALASLWNLDFTITSLSLSRCICSKHQCT